ncbi:MAG TPA: hypothetical protein VFU62_13885 [Hanamia sp.]|nr:hypothetical protein [Hanamia sp.]
MNLESSNLNLQPPTGAFATIAASRGGSPSVSPEICSGFVFFSKRFLGMK